MNAKGGNGAREHRLPFNEIGLRGNALGCASLECVRAFPVCITESKSPWPYVSVRKKNSWVIKCIQYSVITQVFMTYLYRLGVHAKKKRPMTRQWQSVDAVLRFHLSRGEEGRGRRRLPRVAVGKGARPLTTSLCCGRKEAPRGRWAQAHWC